jgi:two-component system nitrogen regulation sensor histidine kinase NtrY
VVVAGIALVLLAWWLRDPLIPYGTESAGASDFSGDSARAQEPARRRAEAIAVMSEEIRSTHRRLRIIAGAALNSPAAPADAFAHLRKIPDSPEQGVVLLEGGVPFAWAGQLRSRVPAGGQGTSVTFDEFYVTIHVAVERGARRAIASAIVHADPPADELTQTLASRVTERTLVQAFRFGMAEDSTAGVPVTTEAGTLMRVDAVPLAGAQVRFVSGGRVRARAIAVFILLAFFLLALGWSDRRRVARRIFSLAAVAAAVAIIPWNHFSNFSRAFNPGYYYSKVLGPFTGSAGAFLILSALALLAVMALIRARQIRLPRTLAGIAALALMVGGPVLVRAASFGIALPPWGATAIVWLQWQVPMFLLLFAFWLAAGWLGAMAVGRRSMLQLRTAAFIGVAAGAVSAFFVWNVTTEQRLQLAMRDVAGLERTDSETSFLLNRFGLELAQYETPADRPELLRRYAISDLAAAEIQVSLSLWDEARSRYGVLDLAPLRYDTLDLARAIAIADTAGAPAVSAITGPTGRQLLLTVAHRGGGFTTVVASPRTRLIAQDPYASLLGFAQPDQTEPPYVLTLADPSPRAIARTGVMTWRRHGNEWHGDQLIRTSQGLARAHVEIDIRSWVTRLVRASLAIIFNLGIAGILWALGSMAEGGFFRWVRIKSVRWARSYRGRLTLALFMFFVVPAVAFAGWSYQRLRGDDRNVRELLVRETLHAAAGEDLMSPHGEHEGNAPIFLYTRGVLVNATDSLFEMIAPSGRMLPPSVHMNIANEGELSASWQQAVSKARIFWGYQSASNPMRESYVLAAPARSDEIMLDRRRRDLTMLVLFATAVGGLAALWLSGIAARVLARDLELAKVEVARAERVLAWGEMARQVAHEIKNPLTPIRLGVQHLRRARADNRGDFDRVLDENVTRILAEIDRLDEIARAFSRYGSAPSDLPPPEAVDIAAILRDVVGLERMGIGGVSWTLRGADAPVMAHARTDEMREVLLNVFENARLARARNVVVDLEQRDDLVILQIQDDGSGISTAALPRVFEPQFSTRTTGSGLGLAISRRLLESWGGTIDLRSEEGKGASVEITLNAAAS